MARSAEATRKLKVVSGRTASKARGRSKGPLGLFLLLALVLSACAVGAMVYLLPDVRARLTAFASERLPFVGHMIGESEPTREEKLALLEERLEADAARLEEERAALEETRSELQAKEEELEKLEAELQAQARTLEEWRTELETVRASPKRLAAVYSSMGPSEAAEVLALLERRVACAILVEMKDDDAAEVLAEMEPTLAAELTRQLAGR